MAYTDQMDSGGGQPANAAASLMALINEPNIATRLSETELSEIAQKVVDEYKIDKESREEWERRVKEAVDLAMLVSEEKNYPFDKAANVKYPLLTNAALQFNARSYAAIVQGNRVVKCVTWGQDQNGGKQARADRVSEHLSYQLLAQMPEWEEDTDKMLVILPIVGTCFRKVFFDPSLGRKVTRLVTAERLVVNYWARSIEDTPRLTEEMPLYPYEIQERIGSGRFIDFDYGTAQPDEDGKTEQSDESAPHLFLEQHRLLDLDGDGYPEPYIVTVHKAAQKVCRIVANFTPDTVTMGDDDRVLAIRKQNFYVKYTFLPSPDNGFYGWGFGWLLADISAATNTTLSMMLDAGHLSNVQGGLVSAQLGIKEKAIRLKMGEWRVINTNGPLNQAVMPITYSGPSDVLFKLLGLLIEAGKDISAIKDVLTGEVRQNMTASATMALIEQGLQVFTSIYKRIHRALKAELGIHARLNRENLSPEEYNSFFDAQQQFDPARDYSEKDMDILPVSDPNVASRMQELAKAQFIQEVAKGNPVINPIEATRRVLEAGQVGDVDTLIMPPPQPNPEEEALKRIVSELALQKQEADILDTMTKAIKNIADAEAAETGTQIDIYSRILDALRARLEANGQGRVPGMEGQPGNAMGAGPALGGGGQGGAGMQGQPVQLDGGGPGAMAEPASAGGM
jgi:chaperonin GroES